MLSREDNERLVSVGPGTPIGRLMRLHWLPFLRSGDVVADGPPCLPAPRRADPRCSLLQWRRR